MRNVLLIVWLLISAVACEKDDQETHLEILTGTWVEAEHKTDTLVFDSQSNFFKLKRGEVQTATGLYIYDIVQDSISLRWSLAGSFESINYYFDHDEEEIRIGNFFASSSQNENPILTFLKAE